MDVHQHGEPCPRTLGRADRLGRLLVCCPAMLPEGKDDARLPMTRFSPQFTITNRITGALTIIERARGFLEAATLSEDWVRRMSQRAQLLEAHHTTHIEGTQLSIEQAEEIWAGRD